MDGWRCVQRTYPRHHALRQVLRAQVVHAGLSGPAESVVVRLTSEAVSALVRSCAVHEPARFTIGTQAAPNKPCADGFLALDRSFVGVRVRSGIGCSGIRRCALNTSFKAKNGGEYTAIDVAIDSSSGANSRNDEPDCACLAQTKTMGGQVNMSRLTEGLFSARMMKAPGTMLRAHTDIIAYCA